MTHRNTFAALAATCALVAGVLPTIAAADTADPVIRAIITYRSAIPAGTESQLRNLGVTDAMAFSTVRSVTLSAPVSVLAVLADDPAVQQIRRQRRVEFQLYRSVEQIDAVGVDVEESYTLPDEPEEEWIRPGVDGAGQRVAVVDTGIWSAHPDLRENVVKHLNFEYEYAMPTVFTPERRDIYYEGTGPYANADGWGHGTHVAGIIAGTGAMSAGRVNQGVAPGAKLLSLKIGDLHNGLLDDAGWESNAIAALDWILRHHNDPGAEFKIVNNSWSLNGTDLLFDHARFDPLAALIKQIVGDDVVMVFAAGNFGSGGIKPIPNGMPEVITVANACKAVDSCGEGNLAGDSSRGTANDVAAPGSDIISTAMPVSLINALKPFYGGSYGGSDAEQAQNKAFYTGASGTSMASPHVAGVVALMLQINPHLSPAQVETILIKTAIDQGPEGHDDGWGWGLVDTRAALIEAHQSTIIHVAHVPI